MSWKRCLAQWSDFGGYPPHELADNASGCLDELIDAYQKNPRSDVRLYAMMALEIAALPESVPFLTDVLREGDAQLTPYAERALQAIDTRESRKTLFDARR